MEVRGPGQGIWKHQEVEEVKLERCRGISGEALKTMMRGCIGL